MGKYTNNIGDYMKKGDISAGTHIKAGGDIIAAGTIKTGTHIEATGDIKAGFNNGTKSRVKEWLDWMISILLKLFHNLLMMK
jgi:hypothetical protein